MAKRLVSGGTKIDPEKLAAWLERQWKGEKRCPICKSNNWSISERALELREWKRHSLQTPSFQIVAMLQCTVCGNLIFINPFIADLFEEEQENASETFAMQKD
jgi:polyferredoxin